ncbi:PAS domain S-box protein [Aurantimonas sp. A2-1-M11]|uniref:PAS domain-containing sensor histidine kinase n=1 Tax=Aurantimonas sp. A2-1-M11 TaxID=3113712 RepID=UPI002F924C0C
MAFADEDRLTAALAENERLRRSMAERHPGEDQELASAREEIASLKRTLHSTEARYRLIVESAVDHAIIVSDLDGRVSTWNDAAEKVLGWTAADMIGQPIARIFTPEDIEAGIPEEEMRLSLERGKAHDNRWHQRADGTRFFANGEMMPLLGDDDEPAGFLKILRDKTREVAERDELEASRERLRLALEASDLVGTWDWDIVGDVVYADSRFTRMYGLDPEQGEKGLPIADFIAGIHPDDRERVSAAVAAVVETCGCLAEEYRTVDQNGDVHWIFARGRCFSNSEGRAVRLPGAIVDRTIERAREIRQATLLRLSDELARSEGAGSATHKALQILGETLGVCRVGYAMVDAQDMSARILGEWNDGRSTPLSGRYPLARYGQQFLDELHTGIVVIADTADYSPTQEQAAAWAGIQVRSLVNIAVIENNAVKVLLYLHSSKPRPWADEEIAFIREVLNRTWAFSQRRRAEQTLIETETRLRLAQEAAQIGTFDFDTRSGTLIWDNRCRAIFGISPDIPVTYETSFLEGLHPDDRDHVDASVAKVLEPDSDGIFDIVYRTIGHEDGVTRHVKANGQTIVENGATTRFVGAVRDVTDEKQAEERQLLLTRELQHRVKNTLAMVNALANQTLRRAANVQDGLAAFSARLIALGHAHDILTQTSWTSAPIAAIVANSLKTHYTDDSSRILASGPDLRLTARQSLALALGLHELATNAIKYGALSNDVGRVTVVWELAHLSGQQHLTFTWRETGGPPVEKPSVRGFGSRLIEQAMAAEFGGQVTINYAPEGLVCTISADISNDMADGDHPQAI